MKKILIPIIFLLMSLFIGKLHGQSVEVISVDANSYPFVTVGFKLFDGQGNEIRNLPSSKPIAKNDIVITEIENSQAVQREVLSDPDCPSQTLGLFSVVFSIDISQSMSDQLDNGVSKIDVTKLALTDWARSIDPKRTETAITAFCGDAVASVDFPDGPIRTFTNDKDSLLLAIDKLPITCAGTNYNAAFLYKRFETFVRQYSGLYWCSPDKVKYKPILIFLTDGNHLSEYGGPVNGGQFNIDEVLRLSAEYNVTIYVIQLGTETITPTNLNHLNQLSYVGREADDNTLNMWLGVQSGTELNNIFKEIMSEARTYGDPPPCYVTFQTDCNGNSATISFPNHGNLTAVVDYSINPDKKPDLLIEPESLDFNFTKISQTSTQEVIITAKKNFVDMEGIEFIEDIAGSDRIEVVDWGNTGGLPFTLDKDSSCKLTVQYNAIDESQTTAKIKFIGSSCEEDILNITASPVTDVEEFIGDVLDEISITPNPAFDFININIPKTNDANVRIFVFDILGNVVSKHELNNLKENVKINIENLNSGNYFVGCFSENIKEIVPLVISR